MSNEAYRVFVLFWVCFIRWRTIWSLKIWWIPRLITIHDLHTNSIHSQMAHFRPWRIEKLVLEICLVGHFFYPGTNDLEIDLFFLKVFCSIMPLFLRCCQLNKTVLKPFPEADGIVKSKKSYKRKIKLFYYEGIKA